MQPETPTIEEIRVLCRSVLGQVIEQVRGVESAVEQLLIGVLLGEQCLLCGPPGTGKATLVKALSRAVGCGNQKLCLTEDIGPTQLLGQIQAGAHLDDEVILFLAEDLQLCIMFGES